MALILNIETATKNCTVSLTLKGQTIALKEFRDDNYSHGELLHVFIDEVLKEAGISPKKLDAIAVSIGPGSYTGLRIGVAAAKGLCFGLNIPLIGLNTLSILARCISVLPGENILTLLDARRMEVYSAIYDADFKLVRAIEAEVLNDHSFASFLNAGKLHFVGDGAEKCESIIHHKNAVFVSDCWPSAKYMGQLSYEAYQNGNFEDVAYFEPLYLKEFLVNTPKKKV